MPSENPPLAELPSIPAKRYFTIGEVSELCLVKPHVLRYWEQEFGQLRPVKRRGNRRYYQHHEVLLVRRIRELLYGEGFTIIGARGRLDEEANGVQPLTRRRGSAAQAALASRDANAHAITTSTLASLRAELLDIADSLDPLAVATARAAELFNPRNAPTDTDESPVREGKGVAVYDGYKP